MIHLKEKLPLIVNELHRSRIDIFERVSLGEVATEILRELSFAGSLVNFIPVVDIGNNIALLIIVTIDSPNPRGSDTYTYTFQFEAEPTNVNRTIGPSVGVLSGLPSNNTTTIPEAKFTFTFLAERNSVAYFNQKIEGSLDKVKLEASKILQG